MVEFSFPQAVRLVLEALEQRGFQAVLVGGCVRDFLRGVQPEDYDVATDALPAEVAALAKERCWKTIEQLGNLYGVVVVVVAGQAIEVATFRQEAYGVDAHRPEKVWYTKDLTLDLERRDFTVNAMAMNSRGEVFDPFGGKKALAAKCLQTVGAPEKRFSEDALRLFRACRFASQLDFSLSAPTKAAMQSQVEKVRGISLERVRIELNKLLLGNNPAKGMRLLVHSGLAASVCRQKRNGVYEAVSVLPELAALDAIPQNKKYHAYDVLEHTLHALAETPQDLAVRWGVLLHDIAKGTPGVRGVREDGNPTDYGHAEAGETMAAVILQRLGMPPEFCRRVVWMVGEHMNLGISFCAESDVRLRWLRKTARSRLFRDRKELNEGVRQLVAVCAADRRGMGTALLPCYEDGAEDVLALAAAMPVHTRDLALDGKAVLPLVGPQKVRHVLNRLLVRVQDGTLENEYNELMTAALAWSHRHREDESKA